MPRKRTKRTYLKRSRWYGDFRDLGGGQEALIAPGDSRATQDPDVAQRLANDRVRDLEQGGRRRVLLGISREATLGAFAAHHLVEKKRAGRVTDTWLERAQQHLEYATEHFGADRELGSIGVRDMQDFATHLQTQPNGRGGTMSGGTARHYLNSLSNLYRRAQAEAVVTPGFNPVSAMLEKPSAKREEAKWLEVHDAALLLEAGRTYRPIRADCAMPFAYPLLTTFLLTGGRKSEILGLEVDDVTFNRKTITFRPNAWRRLKTATSHRSVRLWPQLKDALQRWIFGSDRPPGRLLFPSFRTGEEQMLVETRKMLDAVAVRAGWRPGEIRTKMLRHTFTAARLQCLDHGAPISPYTVAKELGHGGEAMVRRVYGHLGEVRHRSEVLEYRVEDFADQLGDRLTEVRDGTG